MIVSFPKAYTSKACLYFGVNKILKKKLKKIAVSQFKFAVC